MGSNACISPEIDASRMAFRVFDEDNNKFVDCNEIMDIIKKERIIIHPVVIRAALGLSDKSKDGLL